MLLSTVSDCFSTLQSCVQKHLTKFLKLKMTMGVKDFMSFAGGDRGKEPTYHCRRHKRHRFCLLGWEEPLEWGMAIHSSIPAWRISQTEEPGGLQSTGLQEPAMTEAT